MKLSPEGRNCPGSRLQSHPFKTADLAAKPRDPASRFHSRRVGNVDPRVGRRPTRECMLSSLFRFASFSPRGEYSPIIVPPGGQRGISFILLPWEGQITFFSPPGGQTSISVLPRRGQGRSFIPLPEGPSKGPSKTVQGTFQGPF